MKINAKDILESFKVTLISHVMLNEKDNPTEIFETINTTGKKLTPVDMIKNHIFMNSYKFFNEDYELSQLYNQIENLLCVNDKKDKYDLDMMSFFRYYNTIIANCELAKKESINIYTQFKEIHKNIDYSDPNKVRELLESIKTHAWIWNKIHKHVPKKSIDKYFYLTFKDSIYTYYTLVHQLFYNNLEFDCNHNYYLKDECINKVFRIIAKLIFSQLLSGKPEKEITRDIPNIYKNFANSKYDDFEKWMIARSKQGESISILDKEGIEKYINNSNVYTLSSKKTKYLLYGIEGLLDNWEIELMKLDDLSVEHISPQNPSKESDYYKYALKINDYNHVEAENYLESIKHKLPNLTLVVGKTNSQLSNYPFAKKVEMLKDKSFLSINKYICEFDNWTKDTIKKRSDWLVDKIDKLFN